ncbi:putative transposase [Brevibacterium paucivorans]|uniref:Transposase n=1 Tax=Brevibacterium paucivorans TaxID=170994 RepID=A0ABS2SHL2_9MICO|nr:helix-turn-helix domain-containing protein [Brevibacterium paucivorans]MBM7815731.1 putative transposase [Brevibacterium paucivorans]
MVTSAKRERIAQKLRANKDTLLPVIIDYVRKECPLYIDVTDSEIEESLEQNIEMCIRAGVTRTGNLDSHFLNWAQISRSRFEKSVPMEEIFQTYRFSIELIVAELIVQLNDSGCTASEQTSAITQVWKSANAYTVKLAQVYNHHQQMQASQDQAQKAILFDAIKNGAPLDKQSHQAADFFQLNERTLYSYFIVAIPKNSTLPAHEVLRTLESRLTNGRGLCIATRSTVEGFSTEQISFPRTSIAIGPPRVLSELHYSHNMAHQISRTSVGRKPGTHFISDVGWRVAVLSHPEVLLPYKEKYVAPLERSGADASALLHSLETYLANDANATVSARKLHCHPNTLRYRITRFEELTSCSVERTETRVELVWLFEALKVHEL